MWMRTRARWVNRGTVNAIAVYLAMLEAKCTADADSIKMCTYMSNHTRSQPLMSNHACEKTSMLAHRTFAHRFYFGWLAARIGAGARQAAPKRRTECAQMALLGRPSGARAPLGINNTVC